MTSRAFSPNPADDECLEGDPCAESSGPCVDYSDDMPEADPTDPDGSEHVAGPPTQTSTDHENSLVAAFPAFGLKVTFGDLELRLLRDDDFPGYAELLREPIFDPDFREATFPWAQLEPEDRVRSAFQYQWSTRAQMGPSEWMLPFGVFYQGDLVGSQEIRAKSFDLTRTVVTGSWLTRRMHGRGIGKAMRHAVLGFAFDHLTAVRAESSALATNIPSMRTSASVGYVENGTTVEVDNGKACLLQHMTLTAASYERPTTPLHVEGLTPELITQLGAE